MTILLLYPLPILLGYLLDRWFGDPEWLYHPVRAIGWLIERLERVLRRPGQRPGRARAAGAVLALAVPLLTAGFYLLATIICWRIHPVLWCLWEGYCCYRLLAARNLQDESLLVYNRLGELSQARQALSRIVGRDTAALDRDGIIRATVETVAENTSDGVIAPLLYFILGGAPLGYWYKAVNTLDSMVGYRDDRYRYFGTASARLDDLANWVPARVTAALLLLAVGGENRADARRIYRRDRRNHSSPNSAHSEAVCAGALGVQLGGDATYFGKPCHKPTIGDSWRVPSPEDIPLVCRWMRRATLIAVALGILLRLLILCVR